jgi:hypothetical protein
MGGDALELAAMWPGVARLRRLTTGAQVINLPHN